MKVGDHVRHKLDGERLRIKSISKTTAICEEIDKGKINTNIHGQSVYPVRVSSVENLERVKNHVAQLSFL